MQIIRWEPLEAAADKFFSDHPLKLPKLGWDMAVDIFEQGSTVVAKMSLPGIDPDELDISVDKDSLTISGVREDEEEVNEKEYYSKEIRRGSFSRTVDLPKPVEADDAQAEYGDGILTVTMPTKSGTGRGGVQIKVTKKGV